MYKYLKCFSVPHIYFYEKNSIAKLDGGPWPDWPPLDPPLTSVCQATRSHVSSSLSFSTTGNKTRRRCCCCCSCRHVDTAAVAAVFEQDSLFDEEKISAAHVIANCLQPRVHGNALVKHYYPSLDHHDYKLRAYHT